MTHRIRHQSFAGQLDREWTALRHHRRTLSTVAAWADALPPHLVSVLRDVHDLDDVLRSTHRQAGGPGNDLLIALVELSHTESLAGRIVVQRLLGGLIASSHRYWFLCEHDDPIAEVVGALWEAISRFDTRRRRGPVAPSLISDAIDRAFRQRERRRTLGVELTAPGVFDDEPTSSGLTPLVELGAVIGDPRRAGIPTSDLDLLRHLVRADSPSEVARERGVTSRTIRNHRARAISRVQIAIGQHLAA